MKLDYGCGSGNSLGSFEIYPDHNKQWIEYNGGGDVVAIDIDIDAINNIRQKYNNGTKYLVADGMDLPFEDGTFDIVHEHCVLHHVLDYKKGLSEISRVTKTNGLLQLFETVNNFPIYALARHVAGQWEECKITQYYKTDDLIKEIEKYYTIIKVVYYWQPIFIDILKMLLRDKVPCYKWLMYFKYYTSKILNKVKLDKFFCGHVYIEAMRNAKIYSS